MKESMARKEADKLTTVEGGLVLENDSEKRSRCLRPGLYVHVGECMKVILYIQLILFISWASYAVWQTYRLQEASMEDPVRTPNYVSQMAAGSSEEDYTTTPSTHEIDVNYGKQLLEEMPGQMDEDQWIMEEKQRQHEEELRKILLLGADFSGTRVEQDTPLGVLIHDIINPPGTEESSEEDSAASPETIENVQVDESQDMSEDLSDFYKNYEDNSYDWNYQDSDYLSSTTESASTDFEGYRTPLCLARFCLTPKIYRYESGFKISDCEYDTVRPFVYSLKCKDKTLTIGDVIGGKGHRSQDIVDVSIINDATNQVETCKAYPFIDDAYILNCGPTSIELEDFLYTKRMKERDFRTLPNEKSMRNESEHQVWLIYRIDDIHGWQEVCLTKSLKASNLNRPYNCQDPDKPIYMSRIIEPSWESVKITPLPYMIVTSNWPHSYAICPMFPRQDNPYENKYNAGVAWSYCGPLNSYTDEIPENPVEVGVFSSVVLASDGDKYWQSIIFHREVKGENSMSNEVQSYQETSTDRRASNVSVVRRITRYSYYPDYVPLYFETCGPESKTSILEECDVWFVDGKIKRIDGCSPVQPVENSTDTPWFYGLLLVQNKDTSETHTCHVALTYGMLVGLRCGPLDPFSEKNGALASVLSHWKLDYYDATIHGPIKTVLTRTLMLKGSSLRSGYVESAVKVRSTADEMKAGASVDEDEEESEEPGSVYQAHYIKTTSTSTESDSEVLARPSSENPESTASIYKREATTEDPLSVHLVENNRANDYLLSIESAGALVEIAPQIVTRFSEESPDTMDYEIHASTAVYDDEEKQTSADEQESNSNSPVTYLLRNTLDPDATSKPSCLLQYTYNSDIPNSLGFLEACKVQYDSNAVPVLSDCADIAVPVQVKDKICQGRLRVHDIDKEKGKDKILWCEVELEYKTLRIGYCDETFYHGDKYIDFNNCGSSLFSLGPASTFYVNSSFAENTDYQRDSKTGAIDWCSPIKSDSKSQPEKADDDDALDLDLVRRMHQAEIEKDLQEELAKAYWRVFKRRQVDSFFPDRGCRGRWPHIGCSSHPWRFRRSVPESSTPQLKISNDITDGTTSKEEFYSYVRAKEACLQQNGRKDSMDCRRYMKWKGSKKPTHAENT